jgi:hypothetical protein
MSFLNSTIPTPSNWAVIEQAGDFFVVDIRTRKKVTVHRTEAAANRRRRIIENMEAGRQPYLYLVEGGAA